MSKAAIFVILIIYQIHGYLCYSDIVKITCTTYDKNFSRFDLCETRWTDQMLPSISMKLRLLQLPVTNCDIHVELAFLSPKVPLIFFNNTWDACKFLKNTKRYKSLLLFYSVISNSSSLNHTCPYNHDIEIVNAPGRIDFPIPMAKGNYLMKTQYLIDKKFRLAVDFKIKTFG